MIETLIAKYFASKAAMQAATDAVQIHGASRDAAPTRPCNAITAMRRSRKSSKAARRSSKSTSPRKLARHWELRHECWFASRTRRERGRAGREVPGLGSRQYAMGRHSARGSAGRVAAGSAGDHPDARRARHPALDRQPQRPSDGHGQAAAIRAGRLFPLAANQLESQVGLHQDHLREVEPGPRYASRSSTISRSSERRCRSRIRKSCASMPPS